MLLALGSRLGITASVGIWRQAGLWCTVAAAYYLAAQLGFRLRLPSSGISFLWPPTAILSAILLSIATRSWTVAMAGALAGHAIAHSIDGLPPFTWLAQFGANALQATLGAGLARYLSVGPAGFSTFRNVAAFVTGVVLVAPAIASMVAARLYVSMGWSATFAAAWSSRELSSVLAALTFTPPLVVAIDRLKRMDRGEPGQRIGSWVPIFSCVLFVIALAAAQYTLTHDTGLTGLSATDRHCGQRRAVDAAGRPLRGKPG
jgi:integral membrane sensor domain MASE1